MEAGGSLSGRLIPRHAARKRRSGYFFQPRRPLPVLPIGARGRRALWTQSPCFLFDDNPCAPLAIQVGEIGLPRIIQNLAFRYTRWVNWRQSRTGHLFQGCYKAVLVDTYLFELTRYIHLNPVGSGIVRSPKDHPCSGHRAYLGLETIPWLTTEWILSTFSRRADRARRGYWEFVE